MDRFGNGEIKHERETAYTAAVLKTDRASIWSKKED